MSVFDKHTSFKTMRNKGMSSKVPEVTLCFWIIKILCTTVGESAADYLNEVLRFGLTWTTVVMSALFFVFLWFQFKAKKYIPSIYWLTVVFVSVVGTLITDNLTDKLAIPLETTTGVFFVALALTFMFWYLFERTLSVHSIITIRREVFYWLAVLFTFALGTAAGDLIAEKFGLGYLISMGIFGSLITIIALTYFVARKTVPAEHTYRAAIPILAFWLIYILTRPFGASIGDYLSQARAHGGVGLGATTTSELFLAAIVGLVSYLTCTRKDEISSEAAMW